MAKNFSIVRVARGKVETNVDKEFDEVTKQVEDTFNKLLNKLNTYDIRNAAELRKIDLDTATLGEMLNVVSTIIKDLKEILST